MSILNKLKILRKEPRFHNSLESTGVLMTRVLLPELHALDHGSDKQLSPHAPLEGMCAPRFATAPPTLSTFSQTVGLGDKP